MLTPETHAAVHGRANLIDRTNSVSDAIQQSVDAVIAINSQQDEFLRLSSARVDYPEILTASRSCCAESVTKQNSDCRDEERACGVFANKGNRSTVDAVREEGLIDFT